MKSNTVRIWVSAFNALVALFSILMLSDNGMSTQAGFASLFHCVVFALCLDDTES